ncbi:MAG: helix-turn-helix transcriptional regulator [Clostridia bacterium]|nr:helix-turn-helix transcriptional regulator [Clostridia bacterium]
MKFEKNSRDWRAAIDENLRTGFVELLILQLLTERDKYGYELKKEISERTDGVMQFRESALYIPLFRMASRGLVSSYKKTVVGKRFRTYYKIEEAGREYLEYGREQSFAVFSGVMKLFTQEASGGDESSDENEN